MKGTDALAALWDALEADRKPPPPNSITVRDYMQKFNVTQSAACGRLAACVFSGVMETGKFCDEKSGRSVKFFWLAKAKK